MARGWESKSVEEQMSEVSPKATQENGEALKKSAAAEKAVIARRRQALELQREHILAQRTSNTHRRAALAAALEQVEAQLTALD